MGRLTPYSNACIVLTMMERDWTNPPKPKPKPQPDPKPDPKPDRKG